MWFAQTTIFLLLAILSLQVYSTFYRESFVFYEDSKKVEYDIPFQKCGGLQPCCTCWPGKPIYGLGL